jgi:basic membrane protein A and related proteins
VKGRITAIGGLLALVAATALIVSAGAPAKGTQDTFLAGVVSDVGRFNDKGFNQLSLKGCKSGAKKAKGTCRALESRATSDYLPNFTRLVRDGSDINIATGFLLANGTATVAKKFPTSKFAIVDYSVHGAPFANKKGKPLFKNVVGLTFQTNQNSYMIGCLAALMAKRGGGNTISAVGGIKIPTVDIFIAAYRAGAARCVKGTKTLIDYSQDFVDQAKCKELALNQIEQGSKVVFQVAGGCGLGALDAAKEQSVWGVGVDNDQSFLGAHILTSAVKRVDVSVETVVLAAKNGTYKGGRDLNFNLKNKGVAVGKINRRVPKAFITQMNKIGALILSGRIKPPKKV